MNKFSLFYLFIYFSIFGSQIFFENIPFIDRGWGYEHSLSDINRITENLAGMKVSLNITKWYSIDNSEGKIKENLMR
jgi:hypothetical protein